MCVTCVLIAKRTSFTNPLVVRYTDSPTDRLIEVEPLPGWETFLIW